MERFGERKELDNPMFLGSSDEGSVFYAGISEPGRPQGNEGRILAGVAQHLLTLMGLESQIAEAV